MQTSPRLDRVRVENRLGRPPLSDKQRAQEQRIIEAAQILLASETGEPITLGRIALSLRMTTVTLRRYFIDFETILAHILHRHLIETYRAICKIPHEAPNRMALQRAAYLEATRHPWGGFTEPHRLMLQKRDSLPDDLAKPIKDVRQLIGEALGGEHAETAFTLLDAPQIHPHEIEAMLVTFVTARTATEANVGRASADQVQVHPTPPPQTEPPAEPAATHPNAAEPEPKPAQPPAPAKPTHKHYKNWKAARRLKSLQARAARAGPTSTNP